MGSQLLKEGGTDLAAHAESEEKPVNPAAKDADPTKDLVLEAYEEHKQVKMVLGDLEKADKNTEHWMAGLKVLMEDVQHHVKEEENELFPKVKDKVLSKQQLEELGTQLEQLKMQRLGALKRS